MAREDSPVSHTSRRDPTRGNGNRRAATELGDVRVKLPLVPRAFPQGIGSCKDAPRRLAVVSLLALGVGAIIVAAWSLTRGGIGWDSRGDTQAALDARSVDSSWPLAQAYDAVPSTSEFYGVLLYQLADGLHLLTTGATEPLGPDERVTYLYQGAATLVLSVVSVTALAVALAIAFRSLLAGTFAWSLTLATPLWLGMSHVDFKDLPVAAGLTLITAGLVLSLATEARLKPTLFAALLAGSGGAIALATRAGSLALIVVLALGTAAVAVGWRIGRRGTLAILPVLITCGSALIWALGFTWATNPIARISMLQWLKDSAELARSFTWELPPMRVAGTDVRGDDLPWWYVPAWLAAQLPLLTLVAVVGGLAVLIVSLIRRRSVVSAGATIALVPIVLQAIVLPMVILLGGAVIYDGLRHLLFIVPALIAIAAIALAVLDQRASVHRSRLSVVLPLGAIVIVAASLWASIRWTPYAYAFVNPIAGAEKDGRTWDLDYWGVSAKEGVERLHDLGYSPVHVEPSASVGIPYGAAEGPTVGGAHTGLYVFFRWTRAADYGCTTIFTIKRDGHVLGEGARCPAGAPE